MSWILSYCKIKGNKRAGKATKKAAKGKIIILARWTRLNHFKRQITIKKKS